jgi:hypothetical protein
VSLRRAALRVLPRWARRQGWRRWEVEPMWYAVMTIVTTVVTVLLCSGIDRYARSRRVYRFSARSW